MICFLCRLIDFGTDEHEYDDVQDLPEKSTTNNQSPLENSQNDNNNIVNNHNSKNIASTSAGTTTKATTNLPTSRPGDINSNNNLELPPELPPPKQKSSAVNSKAGKTKSSKTTKSKIPRSPSLASSLSYNNFQPPPISGIPPQTPPLPLGYQSKGKSQNPPASPLINNNVSIFSSSTNNNNNNNNIMAGGSGLGSKGGGLSASNGNAQRNSANMSANSRRPQIQISTPIAGESLKNFQYLTLTVRKDENGYGMKVSFNECDFPILTGY